MTQEELIAAEVPVERFDLLSRQERKSSGLSCSLLDLQDARATTVKLSPPDDQPQNNSTSNNGLLELLFFHSECIPSPKLPNINQVGLSHFALTVNDLDLIYKQLSEKGIRFLSSPQASPDGYAKVAFCRDPDGCLIELVELMRN